MEGRVFGRQKGSEWLIVAAELGLVACGTVMAPIPRITFDSCFRSYSISYITCTVSHWSVCPELGYTSSKFILRK